MAWGCSWHGRHVLLPPGPGEQPWSEPCRVAGHSQGPYRVPRGCVWCGQHGLLAGGQTFPAMRAVMNQLCELLPQSVCLLRQSDLRPALRHAMLIYISAFSCYLVVSHAGVRGRCRWFSDSSPGCHQSQQRLDLQTEKSGRSPAIRGGLMVLSGVC